MENHSTFTRKKIESILIFIFPVFRYFQEFTYDVISRLAMGQPNSELFNNSGVEIVKSVSLFPKLKVFEVIIVIDFHEDTPSSAMVFYSLVSSI